VNHHLENPNEKQSRVFPMAEAQQIPPELALAFANYEANYTSSIIKFVVFTAIFIGITIAFFSIGSFQEISNNFSKYRCNPAMMPFAGFFGQNPVENFNFCLNGVLNGKAASLFTPIYMLLYQFTTIISTLVNAIAGLRSLFANFLASINGFVTNVRNRVQELLFKIRMSFLKMQNLMGRVFGTMNAVVFMGTSAMTAGLNVGDNAVVQFLGEFCFHPDTQIQLANKKIKPIKELVIGDKLLGANKEPVEILSTFVLDGSRTPMVRIDDVILSMEHYVEHKGAWMCAKDHPSANHTESLPQLICLNVQNHKFRVGFTQLIVADYDEHETPEVIAATQKLAEFTLNNGPSEASVSDYSLGLDPSAKVVLVDGVTKQLQHVQIGDTLKDAGKVLGIVQETCDLVYTEPRTGLLLSGAQLVFDDACYKWRRVANMLASTAATSHGKKQVLLQLITERCSAFSVQGSTDAVLLVRDYREVPLPEMEDAYAKEFLCEEAVLVD
jgi:hypothetical protein